MSLLLFLFITYKPSRGGGELRKVCKSHIKNTSTHLIINVPSKHNGANKSGDGTKLVYKSKTGKGLWEAWQIYEKLLPIFPDGHTHEDVAFLAPAKRVLKKDGKYIGFNRSPIGKNGFDAYFKRCGDLTGVEVIGSIYFVRYSLTTTLIQSGVNPMEVSKNWTKHTSAAVNKYYQQQIAKETEKQQQHKFEEYVMNKSNNNDDIGLNGNDGIGNVSKSYANKSGLKSYTNKSGSKSYANKSDNGSIGRFGSVHPSSQASGCDKFDKNGFMQQIMNMNPSHLHIHFS